MTTSNIKAIIFDLGRVLVNIDNTLLVEHLFKGFKADDLQELARRTMSDPAMVEFNSGRIDPQEFYQRMRQTYHWELSFEEFCELWCRIFYPMDGMEELVTKLRGTVKLGLLSDTDPLHWNYIITAWPWLEVFEKPTLSYQVGVMKPDPAIYQAAVKNVNTPPQRCLYIDDLQNNVDGARAIGMTALRFENITQLKKDLQALKLL